MIMGTGSNIQDIKLRNRLLVLKHIAFSNGIMRSELAQKTNLSKMTVGNIVSELLSADLITESGAERSSAATGRKPSFYTLSPASPCICGMLIKRKLLQIILSDIGGNIFFQKECRYTTLDHAQALLDIMVGLYRDCAAATDRRIAAVGIACVGPLDSTRGYILNPPYFHGIENYPIVEKIREATGLPTYLVNDATAGALSEMMFGKGMDIPNFAYLHIMNGIGMGLVLNRKLYDGNLGQSGEIGHTSINFNGPQCVCGNRGCLDLYASTDAMRERIRQLEKFYPSSPLVGNVPDWRQIVSAGERRDPLALVVLEEFCGYIAYSLTNAINLLDLSTVIVGYSSNEDGTLVEDLIAHKLNSLVMSAKHEPISVVHSMFRGDAPLLGSVALVADKIFSQKHLLQELEGLS